MKCENFSIELIASTAVAASVLVMLLGVVAYWQLGSRRAPS